MSANPHILFTHIFGALRKSPRSSLDDCSRLLRLSPRAIEELIRAATGASFRELRTRALMTEIEKLLKAYPPMSIKEISFAAGYKSARSFSRAVRRSCGLSPRELRAFLLKEQLKEAIASASVSCVPEA